MAATKGGYQWRSGFDLRRQHLQPDEQVNHLRNPLIFDSNVLQGYFEEANADSYIVAAHVKPPEIGSRPSIKVNDNTAVSPRWLYNVLESRHKK